MLEIKFVKHLHLMAESINIRLSTQSVKHLYKVMGFKLFLKVVAENFVLLVVFVFFKCHLILKEDFKRRYDKIR